MEGGQGFDSRQGLKFFLCPTLEANWIFHFSYTVLISVFGYGWCGQGGNGFTFKLKTLGHCFQNLWLCLPNVKNTWFPLLTNIFLLVLGAFKRMLFQDHNFSSLSLTCSQLAWVEIQMYPHLCICLQFCANFVRIYYSIRKWSYILHLYFRIWLQVQKGEGKREMC